MESAAKPPPTTAAEHSERRLVAVHCDVRARIRRHGCYRACSSAAATAIGVGIVAGLFALWVMSFFMTKTAFSHIDDGAGESSSDEAVATVDEKLAGFKLLSAFTLALLTTSLFCCSVVTVLLGSVIPDLWSDLLLLEREVDAAIQRGDFSRAAEFEGRMARFVRGVGP